MGPNFRQVRTSGNFLLPLVIFMLCFIIVPVIGTVITSMFQDVTFLERRFLFLENYQRILNDPAFGQSFRFTILFVAASVPLEIILGLMFAMLLNEKMPFRSALRAFVLIPWAIPAAISGRIWELIYNYHYGLANFLVMKLGISAGSINWLGSEPGAFVALVISDVWKTSPFVAIILLAGLQTIPQELYEQGKTDGANLWQRFLRITLPLLKPVLVVALLFRTIDALRIFDLVYVLTHGGPGGTTNSLSLYAYRYYLGGDFGYGAAVSIILFVIALGLSILYVKLSRFSSTVK
jgi:multiple sugar transport system permease protein